MSVRSLGRIFYGLLSMAAVVAAAITAGCGETDQIRSYTVAKESQPPMNPSRAAPSLESAPANGRMLAAIVPAATQAWFFKATGPIAAVDAREQAIVDFFASVQVDDTGRAHWQLPSGWKEDPGTGIRAATLWVPADGKPIEISVTTLGWGGTGEELLSNVNRWRGQMGLPSIGLDGLAECTRTLPTAGNAKVTLVDLRGQYQAAGMRPRMEGEGPFAGSDTGGASSPRVADAGGTLPPGHPAIGPEATHPPFTPDSGQASSVPGFEVPASWQQRPPANSFRKAEFGIADGQQQASVTLIDFPANSGPAMTDPLENVNRWRREIGLDPITKEDLGSAVEEIKIDGQPARYVRLVPEAEKPAESQVERATLAAMVTRADTIWFIKMIGARDLVVSQEEQFKAFLKSIRFSAGGGANDGNK